MLSTMRSTLLVIGQTGAGKSCVLNAYLQLLFGGGFLEGDSPEAVTQLTQMKENTVDGVMRCGIDTQGLDDTQGLEAAHVQQMVQFLRSYPHGVNGIGLVINVRHPRFDAGTKRLVRLMHNFFNNNQFWNHVAIIFTNCYWQKPVNKDIKRNEYREKVRELVQECTNGLAPLLPVYFVDSSEYANDPETRSEIASLHAWLIGLPPLPTQNVAVPHTKFFKVTMEKQVVVKSNDSSRTPIMGQKEVRKGGLGGLISIGGSGYEWVPIVTGYNTTTTVVYEEQEREVQTHYDAKTITYGNWRVLRTWQETK